MLLRFSYASPVIRVAVLDDYQRVAEGLADWTRLDVAVDFHHDHVTADDELVRRLAPYDVLVAMRERTPFPASVLRRLPALRLLVTTGRRNASIDTVAAKELGIVVSGTESSSTGTPELTLALMHVLNRQLLTEVESVRQGGWQVGLGRELAGLTLGLVGLGRLGERVARLAQAYDMEVIAWSENLTAQRCAAVGVRRADKDDLFRTADVVSVHLKLGERSVGVVGARELALMKPDAYLINTSRAPIVDTDALLDVVRSGGIAGAALDVFHEEPLAVNDPLRDEPRIVLTPHVGYVTRQTYELFFTQVVDAVEAWMGGSPIRLLT